MTKDIEAQKRAQAIKLRDAVRHAREAMAASAPYPDAQPLTEVRRDYLMQWRMVQTVDGRGEPCGYCPDRDARPVICNVYATVYLEGERGTEQQMWQTCDRCVIHAVDGVEDVANRYMIIVERAQR